jgi:uncharacterized protein YcbX
MGGRVVGRMNRGTVTGLRRYPVKSMLGEDLTEVGVTDRGLRGDRVYALQDVETGKVASAKRPRLWGGLLQFSATLMDGGLRLADGEGRPVRPEELGGRLGRPVRLISTRPEGATLERAVPEEVLADGAEADVAFTVNELGRAAPPGTFFDFAPVHVITEATLARLAELSPRGTVEAVRYWPNLVIRTDGEPFAENGWAGRELWLGSGLRLKVLVPTPRCAVPTLAHGSLPRDPEALRVAARANRVEPLPGLGLLPCVGAYAQVVRPGRIAVGDPVSLR